MSQKIKDLQGLLADVGIQPAKAISNVYVVPDLQKSGTKLYMNKDLEFELKVAFAAQGHTLLYGPASTGKTTMAKSIAESMGRKWGRLQLHKRFEADEWLGGTVPTTNGHFEFKWSPLIEAVESGGVCILEEIFQVDPGQMGPLFTIMDDSKEFDAYCQGHTRRVVKHPDFKIIATDNSSGQGDESVGGSYAGVEIQNEALLSRFSFKVEIPFPDEKDEAQMLADRTGIALTVAKSIIKVATSTRMEQYQAQGGQPIFFRSLLAWVDAAKAGIKINPNLTIQQALKLSAPMAILSNMRVDNKKAVEGYIKAAI